MLTSVAGSLRIELSAAFSMTGANTCPIRSSLVAWAIAVGKMRPITAAKSLGVVDHAGEPRQRLDLAADQQGPQLLELQIARAHAVSLRAQLGLQALRDFDEQTRQRFPIDGFIARGPAKQPLKDIGGGAQITALAGRPATRWFDPALAGARRVLVQALGDLDE